MDRITDTEARESYPMSIAQLAILAGCSADVVLDYESGRSWLECPLVLHTMYFHMRRLAERKRARQAAKRDPRPTRGRAPADARR